MTDWQELESKYYMQLLTRVPLTIVRGSGVDGKAHIARDDLVRATPVDREIFEHSDHPPPTCGGLSSLSLRHVLGVPGSLDSSGCQHIV